MNLAPYALPLIILPFCATCAIVVGMGNLRLGHHKIAAIDLVMGGILLGMWPMIFVIASLP